jgi:hypothetical protein
MKEDALGALDGAEMRGAAEIRAARFTLVDGRGRSRATLGLSDDGAPALALYDSDHAPRVQLALDASGAANLKLHDGDGEVSAWLSVGANGAPSLYLRGINRRRRSLKGHAELCVDEHGCPVLSLYDKDGRPRVLLSLDEEDGVPSLSFSSAAGDLRALLSGDVDQGSLHLYPVPHPGEFPASRPADEQPAEREEFPPPVIELAATLGEGTVDDVEPPTAALLRGASEPLGSETPALALAGTPNGVDGTSDVPAAEIVPSAVEAIEPAAADLDPGRVETDPDVPAPYPIEMPDPAATAVPAAPAKAEATAPAASATPVATTQRRRRPVVLVLLLALAGGAGFGGARLLVPHQDERPAVVPPVAPVADSPVSHTVEAEEFILKGTDGQTHARLGMLPDGSPFLYLTGKDGKGVAELSVLPSQGTLLKLSDGPAVVSVRTREDGSAEVTLHGKGQEARAALFVQADGTPVFSMTDEDGRVRAGFTISADGSPSLSLYDDNSLRAFLGSSETSASLMLLNKEGRVIFQAPR